MSDLKHLPKSIPAKDFEFQIDETGNITKERYHGDFKCKIPNQRISAQIAKHKAFLNAGYDATLDANTKNLHLMIAYCRYTVTHSPEWWTDTDGGYDLFDMNVIQAVYDEVLLREEAWIAKVWPDGQLS